jgi:hypothetical protein
MARKDAAPQPGTIAHLRAQLALQRGGKRSPLATYETIGRRYDVHRSVIWRLLNSGYEPKAPELRARLGLSAAALAIPMEDSGLQHEPVVIAAERACVACGRWFVPNAPLRRKCHICSPPRLGRSRR